MPRLVMTRPSFAAVLLRVTYPVTMTRSLLDNASVTRNSQKIIATLLYYQFHLKLYL